MIPLIIATSDSEFMIVSTGACTDDDTDKTPTLSRFCLADEIKGDDVASTGVDENKPPPRNASTFG